MTGRTASHRFGCRIFRTMAGLIRIGSWVDRIAASLRLAPATEYALRLCLEEAIGNIVLHGREADAMAGAVIVGIDADATKLHVTIEDTCGPFDPATRDPGPRENMPGGLGIRLVRHYASAISYSRIDGTNRLTLTIARGVTTAPDNRA
jgi:serine/threonine-protein kinase RsbW